MHQLFADLSNRLQDMHNDMKQCIAGVPIEGLDWIPGEDMNSLSVLVMHTAGAERYIVEDMAGGKPIGRDMDLEFGKTDLDEAALVAHLDEAMEATRKMIAQFSLDDLPIERTGSQSKKAYTVAFSLLHALDHAANHLGHMQITRQLWDAKL
jgi:hypothetical protein